MDRSRNPTPSGSQKSTGSGTRRPSTRAPGAARAAGAPGGVQPSAVPRAPLTRALSGTPSQSGSSVRSTSQSGTVSTKPHPSLRKQNSVDGYKKERRVSDRDRLSELKKAEALEKARAEKKLEIEEQIRKERIQLLVAAVLSLISVLFWIIAISLDHW